MVSLQSTWNCGNKYWASFLYQFLVRYVRWEVDWYRYFRRSYGRNKLTRLSANRNTRTTKDSSFATRIAMYCQHDGVPSHCTRIVLQVIPREICVDKIEKGKCVYQGYYFCQNLSTKEPYSYIHLSLMIGGRGNWEN